MYTYHGYSQASMLFGDFTHKLRQLDSRIIVKTDQPTKMDGLWHSGIYLQQVRQAGLSKGTKGHGTAQQEKFYSELETGQLDKFLCGVCIEWVPEFDIFNAEHTKIAVPGWRTILMRLIQSKLVTKDKARKVFNCQSLGEIDYDRLTFFGKLEFAKRLDNLKE